MKIRILEQPALLAIVIPVMAVFIAFNILVLISPWLYAPARRRQHQQWVALRTANVATAMQRRRTRSIFS